MYPKGKGVRVVNSTECGAFYIFSVLYVCLFVLWAAVRKVSIYKCKFCNFHLSQKIYVHVHWEFIKTQILATSLNRTIGPPLESAG